MRGIKDLTSKKFGELTVLHLGERQKRRWKWVCQCSCGVEKTVFGNALSRGLTKSCGCKQGGKTNVSPGERFKRLLVVSRAESSNEGDSRWLCRCDCGKEKEISGRNLVRGYTGSCGCYGRVPKEMVARNCFLRGYKSSSAKARGLEWGLSDSMFDQLTTDNCRYCGEPPALRLITINKRTNSTLVRNGIDRKDRNRGYVPDNCVSCCMICNRSKGTMSYDEFLAFVRKVARYQDEKQTLTILNRTQVLAAAKGR